MAVTTAAGTTIGISAAIPASFDETGYEALTFTDIGEITDGGSHGRTYAEVTHNPLGTRGTQKHKGSFNEGNKTLQLAIDPKDAGQVLANEALDSDDNFSFSVAYPGGDIDYFQAKVMSFTTTTATVDSMREGTIELSITTNKEGVGIVKVIAA